MMPRCIGPLSEAGKPTPTRKGRIARALELVDGEIPTDGALSVCSSVRFREGAVAESTAELPASFLPIVGHRDQAQPNGAGDGLDLGMGVQLPQNALDVA